MCVLVREHAYNNSKSPSTKMRSKLGRVMEVVVLNIIYKIMWRYLLTIPKSKLSQQFFITLFKASLSIPAVGIWWIDNNGSGANATSQYMDCNDASHNVVTHTGKLFSLKSVSFEWESPVQFEGKILFRATVVQDFTTFWLSIFNDILSNDNLKKSYTILQKKLTNLTF